MELKEPAFHTQAEVLSLTISRKTAFAGRDVIAMTGLSLPEQ
jgi:hypothetical protein